MFDMPNHQVELQFSVNFGVKGMLQASDQRGCCGSSDQFVCVCECVWVKGEMFFHSDVSSPGSDRLLVSGECNRAVLAVLCLLHTCFTSLSTAAGIECVPADNSRSLYS